LERERGGELLAFLIDDERVFHDSDNGWRCSCIDYQENPDCEHVERAGVTTAYNGGGCMPHAPETNA
jgi:hypothetical protein